MDYTKQGPFANDGPPGLSGARLNAIEDGIKDAAEHHKVGTRAALPAAATANKNWLYFCSDTFEIFRSDGAAWTWVNKPRAIGFAVVGANEQYGAGYTLNSFRKASWNAPGAAHTFDSHSGFSDANDRYTIPSTLAGWWRFHVREQISSAPAGKYVHAYLRKNVGGAGAEDFRFAQVVYNGNVNTTEFMSGELPLLLAAGDTVELHTSSDDQNALHGPRSWAGYFLGV